MEEIRKEMKGITEILKEVRKENNEEREERNKKEKVWEARIRLLKDKIQRLEYEVRVKTRKREGRYSNEARGGRSSRASSRWGGSVYSVWTETSGVLSWREE